MTTPQVLIFIIIVGTMALFLSGRLRHDIVALVALLAVVGAGLLPGDQAFSGFSQPAVITVAAVLVLSRSLQLTGAVDMLARRAIPERGGITLGLTALLGLAALLSAFMNNVGAMALLLPVGVKLASRNGLMPGQVLMPLAFATLLGGMVTLIGTPPNLIISGIRQDAGLGAFEMFDFVPVGLAVALAGIAALALFLWRMVPTRKPQGAETFSAGKYLTEFIVPEGARAVGMTVAEVERALQGHGAQITALVRREVYLAVPRGSRPVESGDVLVVEGELDALREGLGDLGVVLHKSKAGSDVAETTAETEEENPADAVPSAADDAKAETPSRPRAHRAREYAVRPDSLLIGQTPARLELRTRFGINVLAVSRAGKQQVSRIRETRFWPGDLVLVEGEPDQLAHFATEAGVVPLADRGMELPQPGKALLAALIFAAGVALAAFGILPTAVAFTAAAVASVLLGTMPLRLLYTSIDWSVIVLLGAMMPVAAALQATGGAQLIADVLVVSFAEGRPLLALFLLIVTTMFLSDVMNNAATAAVMAPIGLSVASAMQISPDSFLIGVAVGASCSFLTPIGHQNNTLILGPGGFRFGDYWRPGIVLEGIVVAVSMVALPIFWPF